VVVELVGSNTLVSTTSSFTHITDFIASFLAFLGVKDVPIMLFLLILLMATSNKLVVVLVEGPSG